MSSFFRRSAESQSIEATLRTRIADLEAEIVELRDHHERELERANLRSDQLFDRLMSILTPPNQQVYANTRPAAAAPVLERAAARARGDAVAGTGPIPVSALRAAAARRPAIAPLLTPTDSGFRPGTAADAEAPPENG